MTAGTVLEPRAAHEVTLVDLVDRLLGSGVVVAGDVTLSVADIDLVLIDLRTLVASVGSLGCGPPLPTARESARQASSPEERASRPAAQLSPARARRRPKGLPSRIDADPERLEKGLAQLVLTIVELLRELMERQALRRMDDGSLADEEVERLGETFMLLERRMGELKEIFGLTDEDLNLDLGPLGTLL